MARKHGVDLGARITQRWAAEERDARVEAELAALRAKQRREAEHALMADGFTEQFDEYPPAWDAAW